MAVRKSRRSRKTRRNTRSSKGAAARRRSSKPAKRAPRRRPPQKAPGARPVHEVSAATRASAFREIHQVLKKHGIANPVREVHFAAAPPERFAAVLPGRCPPNTVRRVVCVLQPDGSTKCGPQCVPI